MLILALEADIKRKHMLFSILDAEPMSRNDFGKARAVISIHIDKFKKKSPKNRNRFTSESKLYPYFAANRIPPS